MLFQGPGSQEAKAERVRQILSWPLMIMAVTLGEEEPSHGGIGHPDGSGAFVRFLNEGFSSCVDFIYLEN